jgi:hypothetical protein
MNTDFDCRVAPCREETDEIAEAIVFLIAPVSFVGQRLAVDGGAYCHLILAVDHACRRAAVKFL